MPKALAKINYHLFCVYTHYLTINQKKKLFFRQFLQILTTFSFYTIIPLDKDYSISIVYFFCIFFVLILYFFCINFVFFFAFYLILVLLIPYFAIVYVNFEVFKYYKFYLVKIDKQLGYPKLLK